MNVHVWFAFAELCRSFGVHHVSRDVSRTDLGILMIVLAHHGDSVTLVKGDHGFPVWKHHGLIVLYFQKFLFPESKSRPKCCFCTIRFFSFSHSV